MNATTKNPNETVCACAICRQPVTHAQLADGDGADHHVYKYGELSYIELAHKYCAKRDTKMPDGYWQFD